MLKRIKIWDELRGAALSFMIFVHFFYYNSSVYYKLGISGIFSNISGVFEFLKGLINLHTSYLAPFLFLFIVGIISHIKFRMQKGPDLKAASKRFLKLYFSTIFLSLILTFDLHILSDINYLKLPVMTLASRDILMVIAYVYLINEFLLHSIFNYYHRRTLSKIIFVSFFGLTIALFNILAKNRYPTYHALPMFLIVLSGFFIALLGDLFLSINDEINDRNTKFIFGCFIFIPIIICAAAAILTRPSLGSIKEMNIIYFMYCFSLSVILIELLNSEIKSEFINSIKKTLSLMGRHSLGLYIFHFFIGFAVEKFLLFRFVPKPYWPINILLVFLSCIAMAIFLDKIQNARLNRSHAREPVL